MVNKITKSDKKKYEESSLPLRNLWMHNLFVVECWKWHDSLIQPLNWMLSRFFLFFIEYKAMVCSRGRENMWFNLFSIVKKFLHFLFSFISFWLLLFIRFCGCWCRAVFRQSMKIFSFLFLSPLSRFERKKTHINDEVERVRLIQTDSFASFQII